MAPRPPPPAEAPPEPPSGAGRKVAFALLGLLVLVGVVGGAVWFLVIQPSMQEPGGAGEPAGSAASGSAASGSATAGTPSAAVAGASDKDFSPNATGKGGAILTIPAGSGTVAINGTGYRQEWDGTGFLRLKDLEPGVFRAKVPPKGGGPSAITDFKVEANQTCVFTFQNGTWEKSECR